MAEHDVRALPPERVAELAEALAGALNVAMPMRRIFGDEIGDAVEVLLAQEVERAAYVIGTLVAGWLAEARARAWDEGYGDDLTCTVPRSNPYRTEESS